jgi:DNA polymerase-3 subunit delta'
MVESLIANGINEASARSAASAAVGNIARARLLASDSRLAERLVAFAEIPYRLDGTGATVARLVDDLFAHLDTATQPLATQHERELVELEARVALTGERGSGRKALQDRQKRQLRKARTDELRTGLAAIARSYHSIVTAQPPHPDADNYARAITKIHKAMGTLGLNANEELTLQALLLQCPSLRMMARPSAVN